MESVPLWQQIVWLVMGALGTHGIVSQILRWHSNRTNTHRRLESETTKAGVETAKVGVEMAKVKAEEAKDEREHTGKFQKLLLDRVEIQDKKIEALSAQNDRCEERNRLLDLKYDEMDLMFRNLSQEYELLKHKYDQLDGEHHKLRMEHESVREDYKVLKRHVENVEKLNVDLRRRLGHV